MTVSKNIFETVRRGIWSNITGGWYYEPSNSMFCNTLTMYIWVILFIFPLLVGIFAESNISIAVAYVVFIFALFTLIKVSVSELHKLFDTNEPFVIYKSKASSRVVQKNLNNYHTPVSSFSENCATRATESNAVVEMIEILELAGAQGNNMKENLSSKITNCRSTPNQQMIHQKSSPEYETIVMSQGSTSQPLTQLRKSRGLSHSVPDLGIVTQFSSIKNHNSLSHLLIPMLAKSILQHQQQASTESEKKNDIEASLNYDIEQLPCCSKTIQEEKDGKIPSTSNENSAKRRISLKSRTQWVGTTPNPELKDQIKTLIEELIKQHPETTLDAIESLLSSPNQDCRLTSVRNRMLQNESCDETENRLGRRHVPGLRKGMAVRTFQDGTEDLNFSFNDNGSSREVPELITSKKHDDIRLHDEEMSIEDSDASHSNRVNKHVPKHQPTVVKIIDSSVVQRRVLRPRRSSSSSSDNYSTLTNDNESDSSSSDSSNSRYISSKPTTVLRVSSSPPHLDQLRNTRISAESGRQLVSIVNRMRNSRTIAFTPADQVALRPAITHQGNEADRRFRRWGAEVLSGFTSTLNPSASSLEAIRLFASLQSAYRANQNLSMNSTELPNTSTSKFKQYYSLKSIFPFSLIGKGPKIEINRLSLTALFDRNFSFCSVLFDIFFAVIVAILAVSILYRPIYFELSILPFAFVVAGAHFSLLKSVQPDSASPVHGFNWLSAYSRPTYFCLFTLILFLLDWYDVTIKWQLQQNWIRNFSKVAISFRLKDVFSWILLLLPFIHTFGLLPQINTMTLHVLEQIDMHIFGATASSSLLSSVVSIFKSILSVLILTAIAYTSHFLKSGFAQDLIVFAFLILVLDLAYLVSRMPNNLSVFDKCQKVCFDKRSKQRNQPKEQKHRKSSDKNAAIRDAPVSVINSPKQALLCCAAKHDVNLDANEGSIFTGIHCSKTASTHRNKRRGSRRSSINQPEILAGSIFFAGIHFTSIFKHAWPHIQVYNDALFNDCLVEDLK